MQPSPPIRVLHVVDTLGMGGAETWLMEVQRHLSRTRERTIQMDFLATSGKSGVFDEEARDLGATVFYVPFGRSAVMEFVNAFRDILKRGQYTVLHDHQGFASGWHLLFGAGLLPPIRIAHFHNAAYQIEADLGNRRLTTGLGGALLERYATHVLGASEQVLGDYGFREPRFQGLRIGQLYCGFDPTRFRIPREAARRVVADEFGWPEGYRQVLFAGRADRSSRLDDPQNSKNTAFAVEIGIAATRRDPRLRLLFAGQRTPAVVELEARIRDAGLAESIRFAGIRRDIETLMAASAALLFPSRGEGLGLVAVEAQAAGVPVLASTAVPRECLVAPGLVRFRDLAAGPEAWADELLELVDRPRDAGRANDLVTQSPFAIENSLRNLAELYWTGHVGSRKSMRVLHVVDTLGMGGAETWMMEVLRYLRRGGGPERVQMDFLATSGEQGIFDEEARGLGARIHYLRFGRREVGTFARGFRRILRRGGYNAVHDHQAYASGWHFLLGAGLLPPVRVTHVHNPSYQVQQLSPERRALNWLAAGLIRRYATHIAATSRQVLGEYGFEAPYFGAVPKGPLYCGFNPKRFVRDRANDRRAVREEFCWPADSRLVLFAGRLDQSPDIGHPLNHKNSGFAVAVGMAAAGHDPRLRFLFVGETTPAFPVLCARIADAGLADRFAFPGIRKDIERLMSASDLLLFPSRQEGLGMVAVEAQAAGLSVLASSAVPQECVVVPELVRFRDLDVPVEDWAMDLIEMIGSGGKVDGAAKVANSAFSIDHSVQALLRLHGAGQT